MSRSLAAGLAAIAWGQQGLGPGLAAGVASALITWGIVWLVRPRNHESTTPAAAA